MNEIIININKELIIYGFRIKEVILTIFFACFALIEFVIWGQYHFFILTFFQMLIYYRFYQNEDNFLSIVKRLFNYYFFEAQAYD